MPFTPLFQKHDSSLGDITLRPLRLNEDVGVIQPWLNQPYAKYWGLVDGNIDEIEQVYAKLAAKPHEHAYLGFVKNQPAFLLERYNPARNEVGEHYTVKTGDVGLHILLAPCVKPIKDFSITIMRFAMAFVFERHQAKRIVVEPSIDNVKIHQLNKRVGFFHQRQIKLADKTAYLGFCGQHQYNSAIKAADISNVEHLLSVNELRQKPAAAVRQLDPQTWEKVNRQLLRKTLAELTHERLLEPQKMNDEGRYQLISDDDHCRYEFEAQLMALNHWLIKPESIQKYKNDQPEALDATLFILEFSTTLQMNQTLLATYLEEVSSTLVSSAYKYLKPDLNAKALAHAEFQQYETTMTEGHPSFIANNGRIGFNAQDYHVYAPEAAAPIRLIWLAATKCKVTFSACEHLDYQSLMAQELDATLVDSFNQMIKDKGCQPDDYLFMPVHPWQWYNKLVHIFAADIAQNKLICLDYGDDSYLAQQSIRTFFNISDPHKHYIKTALSILNMGFMRGLSTYYMRCTPAINQWVYKLIENDAFLKETGFTVLREVAAIGYDTDYYDNDKVGNTPYKKMLAALWRENPTSQLQDGQKLMTMAALLHVDSEENALLPELIASSKLTTDAWINHYLNAYLTPLLHCFYQHKLVFMPHGENLILVLQNNIPVKAYMKDIGEEICLLNSTIPLADDVKRIAVTMPEEMEILSILTDVFDCIFRYLTPILYQQMAYPEANFWSLVAQCIKRYQNRHPQLSAEFAKYDLFAPEFALSCLNRLQLSNNKQMVDLADPAASLKFAGMLENPIHCYQTHLEAELA